MIKAALILDGNSLTKWQADALEYAGEYLDIQLILSCQNTKNKKNILKNFAYYFLNIFTLRNKFTKSSNYDSGETTFVSFDSEYEYHWQKIPEWVSDLILEKDIKLVIKLGMSLLRIDKPLSALDILSFHHGDPTKFRGRPAGFYEMLFMQGSIGTIVQSLSNKLDAGKVWAIGYSKIYHHSYKKTAENFYRNSTFLLRKALINYKANTPIELNSIGYNYKLPSNIVVLNFIAKLFFRKISRILYGGFYEKKWNIVKFNGLQIEQKAPICVSDGQSPLIHSGYSFYADPFFSVDGNFIRVEALNLSNGLGEIAEINAHNLSFSSTLLEGKHYSYPFSFSENGVEYMAPEVASHSSPYIVKAPFNPIDKVTLKGIETISILDGTIFKHDDIYYIFCGLNESSGDCLHLFFSESLLGEFKPHPLNPVVIDPCRARMGGRLLYDKGRILRFGQNNSYGYGNGISICEVTKLTPEDYSENVIGQVTFSDSSGPHTIDIFNSHSVMDYYEDKFAFFAWQRRISPLLFRKFR